ncbi:SRRM1 [Mytilus coruscus]|uniref:SRRM1 n=1 Tax=Mytilus coruscus TaxID=42192 RepID=A0A6J8C4B7_MYTCO|nr:SRRM1 [Mytilus coruscus]
MERYEIIGPTTIFIQNGVRLYNTWEKPTDELKLDNILKSNSISPGQPRRKHRHRLRISPKPPEKSQITPLDEKNDDISYEKPETPRDKTPSRLERQKTFSIPNYSSQTSTCTTLPSLDRRESVYFQIASGNAADLSSDSSEVESEEPTLDEKTKICQQDAGPHL